MQIPPTLFRGLPWTSRVRVLHGHASRYRRRRRTQESIRTVPKEIVEKPGYDHNSERVMDERKTRTRRDMSVLSLGQYGDRI